MSAPSAEKWLRTVRFLSELTGLGDASRAIYENRAWVDLVLVVRALAALSLVTALLLVCLRAAWLLLPQAGVPLRWGSVALLGAWLSTVAFHLLLPLGGFMLPGALLAAAGLLAIALRARPQVVPLSWLLRREVRTARAVGRLFFRGRHAVINSMFALFGMLYALRALTIPPLGWDTLTYHGPRAVQWLHDGQFTFDPGPGPLSLYRNFFGGGELLMAWAMLPFHSDLFANLTSVFQWLALGLATWSLARGLGIREPYAACGGGAAMFIPTVQLQLNSGYVEIALNAALIQSMAIAVYALRRPTGRLVVLAAMGIGVAGGVKLTAAPPGALVLAGLVVRFVLAGNLRAGRMLSYLTAAALAAAAPVLPWVIFAYIDTGYPLSPMPVEIFGQKLGIADPALSWYQAQLVIPPHRWDVETGALRHVFASFGGSLNEAVGAMGLLPLCVAPVGAVQLLRRRPLAGALIIGAVVAALLVYFSRGLAPVRILWAVSASRFVIPVVIVSAVVSLTWCRADGFWSTAYRRLLLAYGFVYALLAVHWGRGAWEVREAVIVAAVLTVALTFIAWVFRHRGGRWGAATAVLVFAWSCSFLQLRRDETRTRAFQESFALHPSPRGWAALLPIVDEPERAYRIAVTAGPNQRADQWFMYAFYGRRFQNVLVYVPSTRDGGIAHFGPEGDLNQRADRMAWEKRLEAEDVDFVLSFLPLSVEQRWMDGAPGRFQRQGGGTNAALYKRSRPERMGMPQVTSAAPQEHH